MNTMLNGYIRVVYIITFREIIEGNCGTGGTNVVKFSERVRSGGSQRIKASGSPGDFGTAKHMALTLMLLLYVVNMLLYCYAINICIDLLKS